MFTTEQCQFLDDLCNWRHVDLTDDRDYLFHFWEKIFRNRVEQAVDSNIPEEDPLEDIEEVFEVEKEPRLGYFKEFKDSVDEDGVDHDPHTLEVRDKSFILPHGDELSFFIYWLYDEYGTVVNSIRIGYTEIHIGETMDIPATKENIVAVHKTICDTITELSQYYQDHIAQWTLTDSSAETIQQLLPAITEKIEHIKRTADEIAAQDDEDSYPF